MSREPKSNSEKWQPSATLETLQKRAQLLRTIRHFFANKNILEVETPLLCQTSVTDPHIESISSSLEIANQKQTYYLQTSPEYAMKRLLAAGSGPIYQITKAFRQGEVGRLHNPEFTMLEWYRPNFTHHDLMNEVDELLQIIYETPKAERISYQELFQRFFKFNPHTVTIEIVSNLPEAKNLALANPNLDKDTWLQLLMARYIEPHIGLDRPCFVYDFPISQAALAKIEATDPPVASRFEVYFKGLELANGFHELQNVKEQRQRFLNNLLVREKLGLDILKIDELFLAALNHGLPNCAGVALGLDRVLMLMSEKSYIAEVLSFDFSRV